MTVTHTFSTTATPSIVRVPVGFRVGPIAASGEVLLTIKDVAAACKLSETAVRRAIADGELPAIKLRSRMRITQPDFTAWITSQRQTPARPEAWSRPVKRGRSSAPVGTFRTLAQAEAAREQMR
ncbi:MAG TPA: helix-turn-helix domain-containing protein [Solirubrobacteraceae bacterium]